MAGEAELTTEGRFWSMVNRMLNVVETAIPTNEQWKRVRAKMLKEFNDYARSAGIEKDE